MPCQHPHAVQGFLNGQGTSQTGSENMMIFKEALLPLLSTAQQAVCGQPILHFRQRKELMYADKQQAQLLFRIQNSHNLC